MGKRGPQPGAKYKLTDDMWGRIDVYARCMNSLASISSATNIPIHKLEKEICDKYHLSPAEFLESRRNATRADFRVRLYQMATDGKHPILAIFLAKQPDWLGMIDEKSKPVSPETQAERNKTLTTISGILDKILNHNLNQNKLEILERQNRKIEEAQFTEEIPQLEYKDMEINEIDTIANHRALEESGRPNEEGERGGGMERVEELPFEKLAT